MAEMAASTRMESARRPTYERRGASEVGRPLANLLVHAASAPCAIIIELRRPGRLD